MREHNRRNKNMSNTVLKYPGAKNRLANWICSYIPKHEVYLEPYAGSLAVLFNKKPCHIETVNDLHDEVVNYFRILRDNAEELNKLIELTPYSRTEYKKAYEKADDDTERARRFCVRCWMGFSNSNLYRNGFKSGQQTNSPNPARAWSELPTVMKIASERLKCVQIECLPALELISRYDTEDVFMYIDPPYLHGTRKNYLYMHEMEDDEHEDLLKVLVNHPGKILISGYENEMYDEYLHGWHKVQKQTRAEGGLLRTETLWMNFMLEAYSQMSLFDGRLCFTAGEEEYDTEEYKKQGYGRHGSQNDKRP